MQRIAFVLAITVCAVKGSSCTLSTTLRAAAANSGRFIGAAVANYHLTGDASYKNTAKTQFNLVTAENECKFDATEPTRNSFSFTGCDAILSFATANSMTFRGHCLVWGEQTSSFVSSLSSSDKKSAMVSHIKGVLSHYKGKAYGWDVVNEAIADGSSSLKSTVWYPSVSDYIDVAFTTARAADSSTKLFYNDYNCDGVNTKSTYMYTMAKSMLSRGIPIDGVGLQMHISTDYYPTQADMTANFKRFSDIGLEVHLTELDVGCSSSSQWDLQAKVFGYVLNACLAVSGCKNYEVWGVQDSYSWRTGKMPLLFDSSYNAKPAACTVRDIFAAASGSSTACSLTSTLPTGASAMGTCSTSVTGGSSCSYTCSSGYTAVAGKCSSSGTWTTSPSCTSTNTGSCKLSTLPTGASSYGTCSSSVSSGSSCSLGCYSGYTATAGSCSSGSWTTSPSCTANPCKLTSLPSGASGMGTCTSSTASGSTCALSCPSTSTKVTGVCSAGSWNPAPNCTSTCTVSKTCGSQSCGSIWNGCATVSCGSCSSGYTCDGSSCISSGSSSDWTQIYPDSFFSLNWNVDSDSELVQTNFSSYWLPRVVAYTGAQTSWFSSFTTVTVFVKATEGSVNVGLRLGQGSDRPYDRFGWKLTINSGVASSYFCRTLNGPSDQCKSTNTGLSFSSGSFHNLTMQYKFGSSVITYAWLDGVKLYSKGLSMSLTQYSNTGKLFIATYDSTSQKVFKELIVRSKTAVHVTLQECMSTSTWNSLVANLLGVSTSSVSSRVVGSDAYCSDSKKRSGMLPMEVETVIADDEVSMTPSSSLAQILQEAISGGAMVENQVVVTAAATAVPIIAAGEAGAVAFGAASGLSTAAVAGIAAGCAVGGVLIAGAATTGAIVLVKKHMASSEEPAESQDKKKRATFFDKVFNRGVDVMGNNAGAQHSSITNRAPPVEVAL